MAFVHQKVDLEELKKVPPAVESEAEAEIVINLLSIIVKDPYFNYNSISGPEANIKKQAAVIVHPEFSIELINPKIIEAQDKFISYGERCYSFPGVKFNCWRYSKIVLLNGVYQRRVELEGLAAILVQHEIDHLNGKLMTNKVVHTAVVRKEGRLKPSDFCPCGSAVKYGKCCQSKTLLR